ncbi:TetR/AcrR family transcriptional regulator [Mycolicibacterium sp. CH28]|uniref:TetR/AcrR family transcriptional regulator C-terminal domain-containing protein n=1 Tax=Mycolicibacterium sp. CH28 TaxID=2512237 RepID=UPI001081327F|nr:TetR/AcrR family transcriptional regulator C-terminal domain-containing protein [Mycolicibacterium sp. CH28]TGD90502.1 TetR/AcrR family transcriptional regulator [Mycolicibacterium sp. CH28]
MQLHKRDVVAKAAAILDDYGIADLSMRRLARELDVSPGALYWHFANKQELLGAVTDQMLAPACADLSAAGWRERIEGVCRALRDALLSHTDGAELVSASFAAGQSRAVEQILVVLAEAAGEAGVDTEHRMQAARTVLHFVLGATADEQSRLQWDAAGAALPEHQSALSTQPSAGFAFGLRLLTDGLAAQRALIDDPRS